MSAHTLDAYRRDLDALAAWADAQGVDIAGAARRAAARASSPPSTAAGCRPRACSAGCRRAAASIAGCSGTAASRPIPPTAIRAPKAPRKLPQVLDPDEAERAGRSADRRAAGPARPRAAGTVLFLRPAPVANCARCAGATSTSPTAWSPCSARAASSAACRWARTRAPRWREWRARPARGQRRAGVPGPRWRADHAARGAVAHAPARAAPGPVQARAPAPAAASASPATSWNPPATCAACRNCSATPTSPPRRSTPTWISSTWPRSTTPRIRARSDARRQRKLTRSAAPPGDSGRAVERARQRPPPQSVSPRRLAWTPARTPTSSTPPPSCRCAATAASRSPATARSRSATR